MVLSQRHIGYSCSHEDISGRLIATTGAAAWTQLPSAYWAECPNRNGDGDTFASDKHEGGHGDAMSPFP